LTLNPQTAECPLRNPGPVAVIVLVVLLASVPAQATVVERVTLPELVKRSAVIAHGTVIQTRVESEAGGAQIYTYITLAGREFLKGQPDAADKVTFRQIGGQVGDQVVYVPGTPRFQEKQEVLVFLTGKDAGGFPQVMGIFQGAFRPTVGPGGEARVEGLVPDAVTSLSPETAPGVAHGGAPGAVGGSFADFLQRIRDLVKSQAGGPR
jgi:hypothetical protein